MLAPQTWGVGAQVSINGWYVCVPCGYKVHLTRGETFPPCINCMRVSRPISEPEFDAAAAEGSEIDEFDEELSAANLELWELKRRDHRLTAL